MADNDGGVSKVVVGGVVGFALYLLVTGLGFGGRGERGEGRGEAPASSRSQDTKRLSFVMQEPEVFGHPMAFRLRDDDPSTKTYTLEETIARIKGGGRSDMNLRIRGTVIQGPADKALELLKAAGITVWKEEGPTGQPRVAGYARGHTRGHYGNRRTW